MSKKKKRKNSKWTPPKDYKDYSIRLYNSKKKRLISFDYSVVGFEKILKMAKGVPKLR